MFTATARILSEHRSPRTVSDVTEAGVRDKLAELLRREFDLPASQSETLAAEAETVETDYPEHNVTVRVWEVVVPAWK